MFRCQICQAVVAAGVSSQRVVLEQRTKQYPHRSKANVVIVRAKNGKTKTDYRDDPGGVGREIVREVIVCPKCVSGSDR